MPPKEKELNKNGVIGRVESVNVPRNFADQLKRHHLRYALLLSIYARIWLIPLRTNTKKNGQWQKLAINEYFSFFIRC